MSIKNITIQLVATVLQALKKMDLEKIKLLFVFDEQKFVGILTIGDIQLAIIANIDLNTPL